MNFRRTRRDLALLATSDLFDPSWYRSTYMFGVGSDREAAQHYLRFARMQLTNPSEKFDTAAYLAANPDVAASAINPLIHFLSHGRTEGRAVSAAKGRSEPPASQVSGVPGEKWPLTYIEKYRVVDAFLDRAYYCHRYPDIMRGDIDPVGHYLRSGRRERRKPAPSFDVDYYVRRYKDVADGKVDPFIHFIVRGQHEGRQVNSHSTGNEPFDAISAALGNEPARIEDILKSRQDDLRARLTSGELRIAVEAAAELDPLIKLGQPSALDSEISPFRGQEAMRQIAALINLQEQASGARARAVVAVPWMHVSGATRIAGHLASALSAIFGAEEVVVIRTEDGQVRFPAWFPRGCRHINFSEAARGLPDARRHRVLLEFIRSLKPAAVFNVNSRSLWNTLDDYALALRESTKLYSYFFCNEKNSYGQEVGYPITKFHNVFDTHTAILVDSQFLKNELTNRFVVQAPMRDKVICMETPAPTSMPFCDTPPSSRPGGPRSVFWAGRFDRQKRLDLVFRIARRLPHIDFRLWGEPTLDRSFSGMKKPPNVIVEGVYEHVEDLPLDQCDAWLYTSEWDGVPNILIEIATTGVPLVGTVVGGTEAVLRDSLAWAVRDIEDIDAYVSAIEEVLENPLAARKRAAKLRDYVLNTRTEDKYRESVVQALAQGDQ